MNSEMIKQFFESLQIPAAQAVAAYTEWYYTSAMVWLSASIIAVVLAMFIPNWVTEDDQVSVGKILKGIVIIIAFFVFFANLTDFLSPEGMAMHGLINDIRGKIRGVEILKGELLI